MNRFRPYSNFDPPILADLWNRGLPRDGMVHRLNPHELDTRIAGKLGFDARGLIVAESGGRAVGFVHAGFGPEQPLGPSQRLDRELGTIGMLVVDPDHPDPDLSLQLVAQAEGYLREAGAKVIYAGGQAPLNPFYWGLYGGSEFSGILSRHTNFREAVERAGYQPVSSTVLLEADLTSNAPRDPKGFLLRRQTVLDIDPDALLPSWWDALAIGEYQPARYRLLNKQDGGELASAYTWEMTGFSAGVRQPRLALTAVEVPPQHRRKGYGRHLVGEILRHARTEWAEVVSVQTAETNVPALALYHSLNFEPIDTATLYRRPGA